MSSALFVSANQWRQWCGTAEHAGREQVLTAAGVYAYIDALITALATALVRHDQTDTDDFTQLFLTDTPMMDIRAPLEFTKGAFPHTVNLPLMTDAERAKVGTCYKQQGQAAALALGHQLVSGKTQQERLEQWLSFARNNPNGYVYCFRGGLRSRLCSNV